ncbi:MAG TPA: O-antigen polymerase [Terriglobia bacterium]|nr:O-antigen polymerase [Terriglobia bacterium]
MYVAYPLATTPESLVTIGQVSHFRTIQWGVDEALVIVTVGAICAILAYIMVGILLRSSIRRFARASSTSRTLSMDDVVLGACLTSFAALSYVFYSYYRAGALPLLSSNPLYWRAALAQSVGGSFYLGALVVSSMGAIFLMAALAFGKIRSYKLLSIIAIVAACFGNFATASRGTFLAPFVSAGLIYFSAKQKKLTLPRTLVVCAGLLFAAAALQAFRYHVGLSWGATDMEILHGNTFFSNFRDTGWTLAYFELGRYNFVHGKTILAGLLGFLPHSAGSFRSQYRWGTFALRVVGADDPTTHYGLAHVYFADWYVNFGYPGVVIEGLLFGIILRFVDERLLCIRMRARNLAEFDCYGAFRIWTWYSILIGLMSSAAAPFAYPYIGGLIAIRAFTIAFHKIGQGLRAVAHMPPQPTLRYMGPPPNSSSPGMRAAPPARKP